jgi:gamma-glutamyltranspeptidase/glutathione hydrolase
VAAALNVTEPGNTGIGGDMFCLFYDAKSKKIRSLNGSGRSAFGGSLEAMRKTFGIADNDKSSKIPVDSVHAATVPGAAAGWVDTVTNFGSGKVTLTEVLQPAINLADKGFPVSEISSKIVS